MSTQWTDRQQALLAAMDLPVWVRASAAEAPASPSSTGQQDATARAPVTQQVSTPASAPHEAPSQATVVQPRPVMTKVAVTDVPVPMAEPVALDASKLAIDATGLSEQVQRCQRCALSTVRQQPVVQAGEDGHALLVVVDGLGPTEDAAAQVMTGVAGELLEAMLTSIGMQGAQLTPAVKCATPAGRTPSSSEVTACQPWLQAQMAEPARRAVLALGRVAAKAVLGLDTPIGKLRGHVHRVGELAVVVSYAPSYLARNTQDKAQAWEDLCLLKAVLADSAGDGEVS